MPQHDMDIANDDGASVRADINAALQALASNSGGPTEPPTTYAYMYWADTGNGVLKQRNTANTAWIVRAPLAETLVVARAANAALGVGDWARTIIASGAWTQTFAAAATLGDGWFVEFRNNGTGVITLDPNGAEQIDGATTIQLAPGEACSIYCNGTAFYTVGRTAAALQSQSATAFTSAGAAPSFTLTPVPALAAYAANQRFRVKFHAASAGSDTLNVSGLGAKSLKQYDGAGSKVAVVVAAGQLADVEYDGVDFVLLTPLSSVAAASESTAGKVAISTSAQAAAGTDDSTAVTPSKLRAALNAAGAAPVYAVRMLCVFNGTGTVAIRNSGNVAGITDLGVGSYKLNFATPLPTQDVSYGGMCGDGSGNDRNIFYGLSADITTSAIGIRTSNSTSLADLPYISVHAVG